MRSTKIVTSFIKDNEKLLILKRSDEVKTMKGLWAEIGRAQSELQSHSELVCRLLLEKKN